MVLPCLNSIVADIRKVKMKALEISQKMGIAFKYSKGWLQQFKEWWNIT